MAALGPATAIERLRESVSAVGSRASAGVLPFGICELDVRLAGGGLPLDALHEVASAAPELADDAAATLFMAGVVARLAAGAASVLWAVTRFDLYSPGLEQAGLGPDRVVFVEARDDTEVLAVVEDALRSRSLAAVVGEVRRADMTATRRLQLAAAEGATSAFLYRRWRRSGDPPLAAPSSATTRWSVGCAPSAPLGIPGVGRARWRVDLVRQRNGAPHSLVLESCDAQGRLGLPAPSADRATTTAGSAIAA